VLRELFQTGETTPRKRAITHTRRAMSADAKMSVKYANVYMLVRTKIRSLEQRASYEDHDDHYLNDNSIFTFYTNGVGVGERGTYLTVNLVGRVESEELNNNEGQGGPTTSQVKLKA